MPAEFGEIQLYIYTRESRYGLSSFHRSMSFIVLGHRFQGIIQAGYRKVVEGLNAMLLEQSGSRSSEVRTCPIGVTSY